jgi:hypothetical protein
MTRQIQDIAKWQTAEAIGRSCHEWLVSCSRCFPKVSVFIQKLTLQTIQNTGSSKSWHYRLNISANKTDTCCKR